MLAQVLQDLVGSDAAGERRRHALPGQRAYKQVGQQALAADEEAQDGMLQFGVRVSIHLQRPLTHIRSLSWTGP